MEMRNCKKCGKIFASYGERVCEDCKNEEDKVFMKLKEYIYDNPSTSIKKLSEGTEVEESVILRFIREGRIELSSPEGIELECEMCGAKIYVGKYCEKCKKKLAGDMTQMADDSERRRMLERFQAEQRNGMHSSNLNEQ